MVLSCFPTFGMPKKYLGILRGSVCRRLLRTKYETWDEYCPLTSHDLVDPWFLGLSGCSHRPLSQVPAVTAVLHGHASTARMLLHAFSAATLGPHRKHHMSSFTAVAVVAGSAARKSDTDRTATEAAGASGRGGNAGDDSDPYGKASSGKVSHSGMAVDGANGIAMGEVVGTSDGSLGAPPVAAAPPGGGVPAEGGSQSGGQSPWPSGASSELPGASGQPSSAPGSLNLRVLEAGLAVSPNPQAQGAGMTPVGCCADIE